MAKKGGSIHKKRLNASTVNVLKEKKKHKWIIGTEADPHKKEQSVPLASILRDLLGIAKTNKDTKKIIRDRKILVDGRKAKSGRMPVGLMDVISLPDQDKYYRMYFDVYGKLRGKEIDKEEAKTKLGKVIKKSASKGGKIKITMHDGKTLFADNNIRTGDTVVISLPDNKITKILKLDNGTLCYIMAGKHIGCIGKLKEIIKTEKSKQKIAKLESKEGEIITVATYLFVVDKNFIENMKKSSISAVLVKNNGGE